MSATGSKPFVCAECGKSFARRPDLNRHADIHNPDAERFYCAYPGCTHSALQKSNLKTHYISKHLHLRPFNCTRDGCTRSYGDDSSLIRHEKVRHGYFRKQHKPYERLGNSRKPKATTKELPSPSDSLAGHPSGSVPSPADSSSASTFPGTPWTGTLGQNSFAPMQPPNEFLQQMCPEFFPAPMAAPTFGFFDMTFGNPIFQAAPYMSQFGGFGEYATFGASFRPSRFN